MKSFKLIWNICFWSLFLFALIFFVNFFVDSSAEVGAYKQSQLMKNQCIENTLANKDKMLAGKLALYQELRNNNQMHLVSNVTDYEIAKAMCH